MKIPECVKKYPELLPLFNNLDYFDVKTVTGAKSMREFLSGSFAYEPAWMTFLYGVRGVFVRLLGMKQPKFDIAARFSPENVPMQAGQRMAFFKVTTAKEDCYWVADADDKHLRAGILLVVEKLENGLNRFHMITLVYYHNWAGPVYFNVIRPFHHLVVRGMAKAGIA